MAQAMLDIISVEFQNTDSQTAQYPPQGWVWGGNTTLVQPHSSAVVSVGL